MWTNVQAHRTASSTGGRSSHHGAVLLGGAVGALLRWSQVSVLTSTAGGVFPWGTFVVNVVGSVTLATFLAMLLASVGAHPLWRPFFAIGLCGAYTTFSAFASEVVLLNWAGRPVLAAAYAWTSLAAGIVGAHLGDRLVRTRGPVGHAAIAAAITAPVLVLVLAALLMLARGALHMPAPGAVAIGAGAVALGGAMGALTRYALGGWVNERAGSFFPWGTLAVNLTGCLLIGLFEGRAGAVGDVSPAVRLLLVTGWFGGYTTFSTLSFETLGLLREGSGRRAAANVGGSVLGGMTAVALGRWIGGLS